MTFQTHRSSRTEATIKNMPKTSELNFSTSWFLLQLFIFLHFSSLISAIKKDTAFQQKPIRICRNTVQGGYLLSDDNGHVCDALSLDPLSRCCPPKGMQKYMNCKGACLASMGTDQPAEVVDDAPRHLNPGACLYARTQSMLSCDGSHWHTRRLCPCA